MSEKTNNPLIPPATPPAGEASAQGAGTDLEQQVIDELCLIFDPEIPVSIYELGLIYQVDISADNKVQITMTLTAPSCPVAGELPGQVESRIRALEGVADAKVELVWDPPWTMEKMSEAAKLQLGVL